MKKVLVGMLTVFLLLASCSKNESASIATDGTLDIIATTFPSYDWTRKILGERINNVNLELLVDTGVDLHSFQPTIENIVNISQTDMFIYVGGVSEKWAEEAVAQAVNENIVTVNLMQSLGNKIKMEKMVEGMQADGQHEGHDHEGHDHEGHDHEGHDHDDHADEHIWLSLKNTTILVAKIAVALAKADPEYADIYAENAQKYIAELDVLDAEYEEAVTNAEHKTILVADRFPFLYLAEDYNIPYFAAFSACSAETEASFETIAFLSGKVDELALNNIIMIEGTTHRIPQTIRENTVNKNQNILILDSIQAIDRADIDSGVTYLSIMKSNLEILKQALAN